MLPPTRVRAERVEALFFASAVRQEGRQPSDRLRVNGGRLRLHSHPAAPASAIGGIEVTVARPCGNALHFDFELFGRLAEVRLPKPAPGSRTDDLWQHTCFEAFVRPAGSAAYHEINLAPSLNWQVYSFAGYREGRSAAAVDEPASSWSVHSGIARATGCFFLPMPIDTSVWYVALSAVIEETDGTKSYWALAHPSDVPDFHHPDSFVLELAAIRAACSSE